MRDDLAAARAVLKKHSMMLLTASKAYVRHPELAAAKANRDFVLKQGCGVRRQSYHDHHYSTLLDSVGLGSKAPKIFSWGVGSVAFLLEVESKHFQN